MLLEACVKEINLHRETILVWGLDREGREFRRVVRRNEERVLTP